MNAPSPEPRASKWAFVSLSVGILLGTLALLAAVAGVLFLFSLTGLGIALLIGAAILTVMAYSSMQSYKQLMRSS